MLLLATFGGVRPLAHVRSGPWHRSGRGDEYIPIKAKSEIALSSQNSYLKLLLGLLKALGIGRVDDVDEDVRVVKVIPPVRTDLPLPANVPDVQPEP